MRRVTGAVAITIAGARVLEIAESSGLARRELIAGLKRSPLRRLLLVVIVVLAALAFQHLHCLLGALVAAASIRGGNFTRHL